MKKDQKMKFIKIEALENNLIPLNYTFLEGNKIIKSNSVIKNVKSEVLNSDGYKCVMFYKKISKY